MKTHLNFAASDLTKSVAFYATLLEAEPIKLLRDYALFITERPALELALDLSERVAAATDAHYGLCVDNVDEVERAIDRLERAHLVSAIERGQTCCYANHTKVWTADPDGRRWEVYTVHEDTAERNGSLQSCCTNDETQSCCVA
jgi:catechol 2,3-dioxygenase-like lactoylglutathione lyase family enzyme